VNAAVTNYKDRFKDNPKHFKMLVTTAKYNEDGYATRLAKFKEKNDILDAKIEKVEELRKSEEAKKAAELRAEKAKKKLSEAQKEANRATTNAKAKEDEAKKLASEIVEEEDDDEDAQLVNAVSIAAQRRKKRK
jgi:23S rRNA pseudoU1915 N3-methylase RlmH